MGLLYLQLHLVLAWLVTILILFTNARASQELIDLIQPLKGDRCQGPIAECSPMVEFEMDTETSRRILADSPTKHISYRALMPGTTPCSLRGKSYYNCKPGRTNPYHRSCSVITRCRS